MGVYCGKLMADQGADVIKIEPPGGDSMRRNGPSAGGASHAERSLHWLHFNTNKRGITLNITTPEGSRLLRRLVEGADVFLETFQPGYLDSLGLGYEVLGDINPRLIFVSITPFGQTGPYKDHHGSDLTGFAMGGYMYATGWPHTPPTRLWGSQAYHTASNRAFIATLIALFERLTSGLGQRVDVSVQEAVAATTEHVNTSYNYDGQVAVRCGFRHGGQFVATWPCKDGYVSITTNTQQAWDDLRSWMAADGMAGDLMLPKYDDRFILRGPDSGHIEDLISRWAMLHSRQEITDWGQSRHHPWGPVATPTEVLENPQLHARGFFARQDHPESGFTAIYPAPPVRPSQAPWKLRRTAPSMGQHNSEVYGTELGLAEEELELMASAGVI